MAAAVAAPLGPGGSAYPFFTNISTPVMRSAESQQRVDELAGKVFTGYELQKLRTYIPNLRFSIDEASLVKHNMYGDNDQNPNANGLQPDASLQTKLRNFIGSVYVYDILTSLMRDITERVRRATDEGVMDTNRGEIGKLVNALRGFVAVEHDDKAVPPLPVPAGNALNQMVFLGRIPPTVLARIGALRAAYTQTNTANQTQANEERNNVWRISPTGLMSGSGANFPEKIQAITLTAANLPSYNTLVGPGGAVSANPSDDSIPSHLLRQLTQDVIDPTFLSLLHRKKLQELKLDDVITPNGNYAADRQNTGNANGAAGAAPVGFPENPRRAGVNNVMWTVAGGNPAKGFPNIIQKFIRMDVLMFNRMRIMILNEVDRWWKNQGALTGLSNLGGGGVAGANPVDPTKQMLRLMDADYRVSGVPSPQCGPGSSAVFYDKDPNGVRGYLARVVPPYIVAADGTMVENPQAMFGPFCQRRQGIPDLSQARVDDLAMKVFTTYEIQKLRTYIPNIRFRAEEANLYKHNIIDELPNNRNQQLKYKVCQFTACMYVYDILTNLMRDMAQRVRNATSTGVLDTSRVEMGKLANTLRGFVAYEIPMGTTQGEENASRGIGNFAGFSGIVNEYVYLGKLPIEALRSAPLLNMAGGGTNVMYTVANRNPQSRGYSAVTDVPVLGLDNMRKKIEVVAYENVRATVPVFNAKTSLAASLVSDDVLPSRLIAILTDQLIRPSDFSKHHRDRFKALGVDYWANDNDFNVNAAVPTDPADNWMYPGQAPIPFENIVQKFIRRDVLAFNRLRLDCLALIDQWWRSHGVLQTIGSDSKSRPHLTLSRMMNVDYKVSGIPGSCGRGSAPVFFNVDPAGPDGEYARIVDPYIRAPDGSMVENPMARVGPICQRRMGDSDLLSGYPTGGPGPTSNMVTSHLMGAHRRRRVATKKRAPRRGRK
eukprot:jgi/Mesvir1/1530/Mv14513-RA.1